MKISKLAALLLISGLVLGYQNFSEYDDPYMLGVGLGLDYPTGPNAFSTSTKNEYDFSTWFRYRLTEFDAIQLGYDHLQFIAKPDSNPFPAVDNITVNYVRYFEDKEKAWRPLAMVGLGAAPVMNYPGYYTDISALARIGIEYHHDSPFTYGIYASDTYIGNTSNKGASEMNVLGVIAGISYSFGAERHHHPTEVPPAVKPAPAAPPVSEVAPQTMRVGFQFEDDSVSEEFRKQINDLAESLPPNAVILIDGHTDAVGVDAYNRDLSERRADAVRNLLLAHSVDEERIRVEGHGSSQPMADNSTVEGRQTNRRVVITISSAPAVTRHGAAEE